MSGHSKWSTIKHKKAIKDQVRGKIFTKLTRSITLAVTEGGGIPDPDKNIRLRVAIAQARAANMPKDNIQRAIDKGSGEGGAGLKEVIYEAFGPGGVNLIITAATDNPNRTLPQVRQVLERGGGKLGGQGSVAYQFRKCGSIRFDVGKDLEEDILAFAEAVDAFDIEVGEGSTTVYFPFENLGRVRDHIGSLSNQSPEVDYKPTSVVVSSEEVPDKIFDLIEALEDLDDVQQVYTNLT